MTGFGRGVAEHGAARATVDIRAVNHRFVDLKLRAQVSPGIEDAIATRVRAAIERGALTIAVRVDVARGVAASRPRIDAVAARAVYADLAALASELHLPKPDLSLVIAQPGVLVTTADAPDDDAPDPADAAILDALDRALVQLTEMRAKEGEVLAAELHARLDLLAAARAEIQALADGQVAQLQRRLADRLRRLLADEPAATTGGPASTATAIATGTAAVSTGATATAATAATAISASLDPVRLAQEVALLAERADITEELVRLGSHIGQARALVNGAAPAGRRLDFLVQEIGRELNTIGSKSQLVDITNHVVAAKAELEKLREQVANVE